MRLRVGTWTPAAASRAGGRAACPGHGQWEWQEVAKGFVGVKEPDLRGPALCRELHVLHVHERV